MDCELFAGFLDRFDQCVAKFLVLEMFAVLQAVPFSDSLVPR
jgi:hypothetical protein